MANPAEQFHIAVRKNCREEAEKLLDEGVNINCVYYGMTPLHVAIQKGNTDMAVWLLDKGADTNASDCNKVSVFESAVTQDQVQVVKKMIEFNVNLNQRLVSCQGHTALTYSAERKMIYMAQELISGGANVNFCNTKGESPMYICALEGHNVIMDHLLQSRDLDKNLKCGPEEQTALIASVTNDHIKTTKQLLKAGCIVNAYDGKGWTALWHAVNSGSDSLVRALVNNGADVGQMNNEGKLVIDMAQENEDDDIVRILQGNKN